MCVFTFSPPYCNYFVLTSSDGAIWTSNSGTGFSVTSVIFVSSASAGITDQFFAFCYGINDSVLMTSADGMNWTTRNSGLPPCFIRSATYGNGQLVAVGYQIYGHQTGAIFYSPDATTWTIKTLGNNVFPNSVTFGNGLFVAVGKDSAGDSANILISKVDPNGVLYQSNTKSDINGIKINSANNIISAILPYSLSHSQIKVGIFNISGRRIYSSTLETNNGTLKIPAKGFAAGKYFLSMTDEKNRTLNASFVLAR
jgi:hypothetical protein